MPGESSSQPAPMAPAKVPSWVNFWPPRAVRTSIPTWWLETSFKRGFRPSKPTRVPGSLGLARYNEPSTTTRTSPSKLRSAVPRLRASCTKRSTPDLRFTFAYVGLASPQLHIARVRARVGRGGHEIPEAKIRERYPKSLANLVSFIGTAAEVHVFDNSAESADGLPQAIRVFRMRGERIIEPDLETLMTQTPNWAKPVVAAAVKAHTARRRERKKK